MTTTKKKRLQLLRRSPSPLLANIYIDLGKKRYEKKRKEKMAVAKVGVNGYGVIGKRIADAVRLQDDMELVGVTARTADFRLFPARKANIPIFAVDGEAQKRLASSGFKVQGELKDLLGEIDVIVDATPAGVGAKNKSKYDRAGVKSIFQGGEKHELAKFSFVAQVNYDKALGKKSLRVVSCNTTAICRVVFPFVGKGLLKKAYVALVRRGADPVDSHKQGPLGTVVLEELIPSHQGPDAQTVIPNLDILTMAVAVPSTLGHTHVAFLKLGKNLAKQEVLKLFKETSRIVPIKHTDGFSAQNSVVELMRDLGRPRADMWEVVFWEDSLYAENGEVAFHYQVHNEGIVIPENIDAIRAVSGTEKDGKASMARTDAALGVVSAFDV